MPRIASLIFLLATCAAQSPVPQQPVKTTDRPSQPNFVYDDDGGSVQAVPADLSPASPATFHGGAVMKSVQQVSIFLGSGWASADPRSRRGALSDLLASPAQSSALSKFGIRTLPAQPLFEDFTDLSKSTAPVNDLAIQRKLADLLAGKAIPAPSKSTVYVVYLAPEVSSTLGGPKAQTDYAAYHSFVHLAGSTVLYAVVPYQQNQQNHITAASRALVETALNPLGNGWF